MVRAIIPTAGGRGIKEVSIDQFDAMWEVMKYKGLVPYPVVSLAARWLDGAKNVPLTAGAEKELRMIVAMHNDGKLAGKFATLEDAEKVLATAIEAGTVLAVNFDNPVEVELLTPEQLLNLLNSVTSAEAQVTELPKKKAVAAVRAAVEAFDATPAKAPVKRADAFRKAAEALKPATVGTKVAKAIDFMFAHQDANNGEGVTLEALGTECAWEPKLARGYLVENVWWLGYGVQQTGELWTLQLPEGVTERPAHAGRTRTVTAKPADEVKVEEVKGDGTVVEVATTVETADQGANEAAPEAAAV